MQFIKKNDINSINFDIEITKSKLTINYRRLKGSHERGIFK